MPALTFARENADLLFVIGMAAILSGSVIGVVASRSGRRLVRFVSVLLLLAGAASLIGAMAGASLTSSYRLLAIVLVFGVLLAIFGLVVLLIEARRRAPIKQGGLLFAIGLLAGVGSLILPITPGQFTPIVYQSPTPTRPTQTRTPLPSRTPAIALTPTASPSVTPLPTALPTLTLTLPRIIATSAANGLATEPPIPNRTVIPAALLSRVPASPMATTEGGIGCIITPFRNVNLRDKPDAESTLIDTIPFDSALTGSAQVVGWWRVMFAGKQGWVTKDFTAANAACARLPAP